MVQDDEFSIISVSSDDEEEIVFQAGVQADTSEELSSDTTEEYEEETIDDGEATQAGDVQQETSVPSASQEDDYQETTLEDLKATGPFPKTQMIILIAAFLFIVGITIAYFLTH